MGPCRGARIGRDHGQVGSGPLAASMGPCRGARIGTTGPYDIKKFVLLQWGRAGGHGSGPRARARRCCSSGFNGAVPGGTDRGHLGLTMELSGRMLQWGRAGGHGSGPADVRHEEQGLRASMGPCRGARIGPSSGRSWGWAGRRFNGAVPGGTDRVGQGRPLLRRPVASMGPCRGARIGVSTANVQTSPTLLQWGRAGGHGSGVCLARRPRSSTSLQWGRAGGHGSGITPAHPVFDGNWLQWGRAGGHGSGTARGPSTRTACCFNGAVPGGTDRGRSARQRTPGRLCFNGAVPGGTDRATPQIPQARREVPVSNSSGCQRLL